VSTYRLDKLFSPRSVAVVGASPRATSPGGAVLKNLRGAGFEGSLHLVNPHYDEIAGIKAVKTIAELPDAPDLSAAQRESKVVGTTDYPCVRHDPTPRAGLVLVGDAATTSDPTPAPGCGWAFRSADWLVEASAADLAAGNDLRPAMRRYRRSLRFIEDHDRMMRSEALAQPPSRLARMVTRAASVDPVIGVRLYRFANRDIATSELLNPATLVRAFRLTRRMSG